MTDNTHPYSVITPDFIMDAIESTGLHCDGRLLELNSYENRVYQVGIDESEPIIAKFYRPDRWSKAQIAEEHSFTEELVEQGLSVIPPSACFEYEEFTIALFPRKGGRAPAVDNLECLEVLGRFIARLHNVGATSDFEHRPNISIEDYGDASRAYLLEHNFLPIDIETAYDTLTSGLLALIRTKFDGAPTNSIRLHADCHMGNVLWRDEQPHFVDFDDARMGPPVQDLWMLLSGDEQAQSVQMSKILSGYRDFRELDLRELQLIEPLRTLRMMYHAAWIARRWDDPAFPRAFPFFNTQKYWSDHILELREQWAAMESPSLSVFD